MNAKRRRAVLAGMLVIAMQLGASAELQRNKAKLELCPYGEVIGPRWFAMDRALDARLGPWRNRTPDGCILVIGCPPSTG